MFLMIGFVLLAAAFGLVYWLGGSEPLPDEAQPYIPPENTTT